MFVFVIVLAAVASAVPVPKLGDNAADVSVTPYDEGGEHNSYMPKEKVYEDNVKPTLVLESVDEYLEPTYPDESYTPYDSEYGTDYLDYDFDLGKEFDLNFDFDSNDLGYGQPYGTNTEQEYAPIQNLQPGYGPRAQTGKGYGPTHGRQPTPYGPVQPMDGENMHAPAGKAPPAYGPMPYVPARHQMPRGYGPVPGRSMKVGFAPARERGYGPMRGGGKARAVDRTQRRSVSGEGMKMAYGPPRHETPRRHAPVHRPDRKSGFRQIHRMAPAGYGPMQGRDHNMGYAPARGREQARQYGPRRDLHQMGYAPTRGREQARQYGPRRQIQRMGYAPREMAPAAYGRPPRENKEYPPSHRIPRMERAPKHMGHAHRQQPRKYGPMHGTEKKGYQPEAAKAHHGHNAHGDGSYSHHAPDHSKAASQSTKEKDDEPIHPKHVDTAPQHHPKPKMSY